MVTGWRRAFCTSIPKDRQPKVSTEKQQQQQQHHHCDETNNRSPKISSKFGFFSSNPSTPRLQSQPVSSPSLRCRTTTTTTTTTTASTTPTTARTPNSSLPNSPKLQCHVTKSTTNSPRLFNPSSPKSPSSFSLLKLRVLSKTRCGICLQSVKAGQGTAIFTAECSHSFHFPCIASHVKKSQALLCPVCTAAWKDLPLLSLHHPTRLGRDSDVAVSNPNDSKPVTGKTLRVYDDDEPLMSPTTGARFNPIPENDEEGDNAENEFQGFFVTRPPMVEESGRGVELRLLPEAAVVAVGRGYETYAVVMKLKAPPPPSPATAVAAIDVVAVVDVGATAKIHAAKRALRMVASSLRSNDRLSIVAFSAASKRLLPLRRMTSAGKRSARRIADALGAVAASGGQAMSVGDAVKKAAKVLEDRRERNPAATIVLLAEQTRRLSPPPLVHVPVHALPLGESDDALTKRVGCILSVVVQDLRLNLSPASPAEIAAVYSLTDRPAALGSGAVRLGDLHAEEEREFLLELRVATCAAESHHVLSVRSSHRDPATEVMCSREQALLVPRAQGVRSAPPSIERLRSLHVATRAVAESRRLAEHGDLSGAHHLLASARALLMSQSKSGSAEEFARGLEAELAELHRLMSHSQRPHRARHVSNRLEDKPEPLTPTSAWRAAERLAKVAIMRKSMNRVSDLHGFENARF